MKLTEVNKFSKLESQEGTDEEEIEPEANRLVTITYGKFVYDIKFRTIKLITTITVTLLIYNILFSLDLFYSCVKIRQNLGYFIDMVSEGDGSILPLFQSIPIMVFVGLDMVFIFTLCRIFKRKNQSKYNNVLFISILLDFIFVFVTIILLFVIMNHIYQNHTSIHDGIVEAMNSYSNNSLYKGQIDRLQIEFQCCGSKKYDEWYNIEWYDNKLLKSSRADKSQTHTPFSCCSITSLFPCVHHNIENTGKFYLYTPEQNLSISTNGCYDRILIKTKEMGWQIMRNLILYILVQCFILIGLRLLQTAHYPRSMFEGHSRIYTVWIFGRGVIKEPNLIPPPIPPIPEELMK